MIANKSDLCSLKPSHVTLDLGEKVPVHFMSFTKDARQDIIKRLESTLTPQIESSAKHSDFLITRHRHRTLLEECRECLSSFMNEEQQADIACEELRMALTCLQKITGHIDVEEVLDVLFKDFCIGK